jgi:hypothetical protein
MNKKVTLIVLALGLLMLFTAVAPAMAKPAKKVPASTELISALYPGPAPEVKVTKSDVVHVDGINYINQRTLTVGEDTYDEVYVVGSFDIDWNPKTGTAVTHFTAVWYVGSLEAPTDNGFSGNSLIKVFNVVNPMTLAGADYTTSHFVFQGFGSFAQYTLKFYYEGLYPATEPSGYCIIPNN